MVRVLELGESIVVRRHFNPRIEYLDLLQRRNVIVNNHPPGTHNRHLADFSRVQPAALDQRGSVLAESQMNVRHIFDPRCNMGLAPAIHTHGYFLENVQDDGNIVRRQVPGDIDVLLKKPQVQAARTDVPNVTNVTAIHDLLDLHHRRRI